MGYCSLLNFPQVACLAPGKCYLLTCQIFKSRAPWWQVAKLLEPCLRDMMSIPSKKKKKKGNEKKCVVMKRRNKRNNKFAKICNQHILMTFQQSELNIGVFFLNLKHHYFDLLLVVPEFSSCERAVIFDFWSNNSFRLDSLKPRSSTGLTSLHVSGLFSWPDEVAVSPSTSTPTVLRHHTVSPH